MAYTLEEKIQVEAIKCPDQYYTAAYEHRTLLTNGSYGVLINNDILMIDQKKCKGEIGDKFEIFDLMEEAEQATLLRDAVILKDKTAAIKAVGDTMEMWVQKKFVKFFGKNKQYYIAKHEEKNVLLIADEYGELTGFALPVEVNEVYKTLTYIE